MQELEQSLCSFPMGKNNYSLQKLGLSHSKNLVQPLVWVLWKAMADHHKLPIFVLLLLWISPHCMSTVLFVGDSYGINISVYLSWFKWLHLNIKKSPLNCCMVWSSKKTGFKRMHSCGVLLGLIPLSIISASFGEQSTPFPRLLSDLGILRHPEDSNSLCNLCWEARPPSPSLALAKVTEKQKGLMKRLLWSPETELEMGTWRKLIVVG